MTALSALLVLATLAIPDSGQGFADVLDVVAVEVPVQVYGKDGLPIRGLTADSFELFDGRQRQEISGFEEVDLTAGAGTVPTAAARRCFLVVFDLSFSEPEAIVGARRAARELLAALHPADLVGVATYSLEGGARMVLGFTPDRRQAALAIDTLGLPGLVEPAGDPLGLTLLARAETAPVVADEAVLAALRETAVTEERRQRGFVRNQISAFTTAFTDLARALQGIEGRKQVVLVSGGFDTTLLVGTEDIRAQANFSQASGGGRIWDVDSERRFGSTSSLSVLEEMLEEFKKADAEILTVDAHSLRSGGGGGNRRGTEASLFMMADRTGGELYRNFRDPAAALGERLERTAVTYVLTFHPGDLEPGEYRRLKVKLADGPPGARLDHRPGYVAPRAFASLNPLERRLDAAGKLLSGTDGGALASAVLAAPVPAGDGAYVPVFVEVSAGDLTADAGREQVELEIFAYAIAAGGDVADFFSQSLALDLNKVGSALAISGLKFLGHLDLAPGDYNLRVLVRDRQTGRSSHRALTLSVPRFAGAEPALLDPLFPEPWGKWLLVKAAGATDGAVYPFLREGRPFVPAARPVVAPRDRVPVQLLAYNVGDGPFTLASQVLSVGGETVEGPQVELVDHSADGDGPARLELTFAPQGLPPGDYRLIIRLGGAGSGAELVSSTPFSVASSG